MARAERKEGEAAAAGAVEAEQVEAALRAMLAGAGEDETADPEPAGTADAGPVNGTEAVAQGSLFEALPEVPQAAQATRAGWRTGWARERRRQAREEPGRAAQGELSL